MRQSEARVKALREILGALLAGGLTRMEYYREV
jgi:hypothetical protein